jgi:hypothetical protein
LGGLGFNVPPSQLKVTRGQGRVARAMLSAWNGFKVMTPPNKLVDERSDKQPIVKKNFRKKYTVLNGEGPLEEHCSLFAEAELKSMNDGTLPDSNMSWSLMSRKNFESYAQMDVTDQGFDPIDILSFQPRVLVKDL